MTSTTAKEVTQGKNGAVGADVATVGDDPAPTAKTTRVGMGVDLNIPTGENDASGKPMTQTVALFVPDVTSITGDGNFEFELEPGTSVTFTLQQLYNGLQGMFTFLPAQDFSTLPAPVSNLATKDISIKRFNIVIQASKLAKLGIEVDIGFEWTIPGTTIEIETFKIAVDYDAAGLPSVQVDPAPANPALTG